MREALRYAEKGRGHVSPNPLVGALVVKNGRIVSRGAHLTFGGPHAEIIALRKAGNRARGADLFVTLEPCSTHGKTGPCTHAIAQAGVRRVFVGSADPNPKHRGRGFTFLRRAGIKVRSGFLADLVAEQNKGFFSVMTKGRPFVILKMAQSLDGKIATVTGKSKWITSEKTRNFVRVLRSEVDGIMVGTRTILQDNPRLSAPIGRRRYPQPARIVLDRTLRLDGRSNVFRNDGAKIYLITSKQLILKADCKWKSRVHVLGVSEKSGRLDLTEALKKLAEAGLTSVLAEGGGELAASFIEKKLVDRVYWCVAPKLVGGRNAMTSLEGRGITKVSEAHRVKVSQILILGGDLIIVGRV